MTQGIFAAMTPDTHCTGSNARDAEGVGVFATDPSASQWCAVGWIEKHGHMLNEQLLQAAGEVARQVCGSLAPHRTDFHNVSWVSYANDTLGYTFIRALQEAGI